MFAQIDENFPFFYHPNSKQQKKYYSNYFSQETASPILGQIGQLSFSWGIVIYNFKRFSVNYIFLGITENIVEIKERSKSSALKKKYRFKNNSVDKIGHPNNPASTNRQHNSLKSHSRPMLLSLTTNPPHTCSASHYTTLSLSLSVLYDLKWEDWRRPALPARPTRVMFWSQHHRRHRIHPLLTHCPFARQIRPRRRRNQFSVCLEPSVVAGGWWIKPSLAALPLFVVVVQVVFTRGRVVRGFTPGLEREGRLRRRHLSKEGRIHGSVSCRWNFSRLPKNSKRVLKFYTTIPPVVRGSGKWRVAKLKKRFSRKGWSQPVDKWIKFDLKHEITIRRWRRWTRQILAVEEVPGCIEHREELFKTHEQRRWRATRTRAKISEAWRNRPSTRWCFGWCHSGKESCKNIKPRVWTPSLVYVNSREETEQIPCV